MPSVIINSVAPMSGNARDLLSSKDARVDVMRKLMSADRSGAVMIGGKCYRVTSRREDIRKLGAS